MIENTFVYFYVLKVRLVSNIAQIIPINPSPVGHRSTYSLADIYYTYRQNKSNIKY